MTRAKETKPRRPKGEGSICKLKTGKYLARYKKSSKTCDTRPQASAWIKEQIKAEQAAIDKNDLMFHAYLNSWAENYKKNYVARDTYIRILNSVSNIKDSSADIPIQEVDQSYVQQIISRLSEKAYSYSTINKVKMLLGQAFRQAVKDKVIASNPIEEKLKMPPKKEKKAFALKPNEQKALEAIADEYVNGDFIIFLMYTGLRMAEAKNLTWQDVDLDEGRIVIRTSKTITGQRILPLVTMSMAILRNRLKMALSTDTYVFYNSSNNMLNNNLRRLCHRMAKRAGVREFSPHMCRHTFATRLLERGANIKTVSELLGHSSVEVTLRIYSHISPNLKKEAILLLDDEKKRDE